MSDGAGRDFDTLLAEAVAKKREFMEAAHAYRDAWNAALAVRPDDMGILSFRAAFNAHEDATQQPAPPRELGEQPPAGAQEGNG